MALTSVPGQTTSFKGEITVSRQSIYELSTEQHHILGEKLRLGDRIFRYGSNGTGAALSPGYMTTGATVVVHAANISVTTSAVIGQTYVDVTHGATAVVVNQYAGGYLWFNAGGVAIGEGSAYKIKSHKALAAVGGTLRLHLYDPLGCALTATTTKATLYGDPWRAVVIHPATTPTNRPTGVPLITVTQSTATVTYHAWLQTGGFCPIFCGATYTIGAMAGVDDANGQLLTGVTTQDWGVVVQIGSAAEHPSLIWLTLDQ